MIKDTAAKPVHKQILLPIPSLLLIAVAKACE